jgi:RNase H-like domain found in reverse transcriptase
MRQRHGGCNRVDRKRLLGPLRYCTASLTFRPLCWQSHILAPLAALAKGKGAVQWMHKCQTSFDTMKALLAKDAFLQYPDHNKRFDIYCDAIDLQLGAAILHHVLSLVGQARLIDTMSLTFYSLQLYKVVEAVVVPCAHCQRYKNVQRGHGAAPQEADILPWSLVAVDTIGPRVLSVQNRTDMSNSTCLP